MLGQGEPGQISTAKEVAWAKSEGAVHPVATHAPIAAIFVG